MYLLAFIVPVFAILLESYPRFLNRKFGVDIWTHLLYLKEYHKRGGIPKRIESGFIVGGTYDYPPAFISILSRFPFRIVERYEFLFSPFFDAIHLVIIFIIVQMLTQNVFLAFLTQLIYVFTPIVIIENSSATPRSLGYTLFTLVFISLFLFISSGNSLFFVAAIVVGAFIFLSHRFTTQGFLFFSLIFSVVFLNIAFILCFILAGILAIGLSRGFYLTVLKGHIGNLKFWHQVIKYRFYHQVKGESKKAKTNDFVFNIYNQFLKFPPFVLAITNPWIIAAFYLVIQGGVSDGIRYYMIVWILVSYVFSLLTIWIPALRFLGEGQRYLELSAFPAAFIAATVLLDSFRTDLIPLVIGVYSAIAVLSLVTIFVIQRKAIVSDLLRTLTPDLDRMFTYLKSLKKKPRLLCIPHQMTTSTIYHTGCPVFVNADYKDIYKIIDVYPYIQKPLRDIMKKNDLDLILLNERYAAIEDLRISKRYSVVKRYGDYVLVKLDL